MVLLSRHPIAEASRLALCFFFLWVTPTLARPTRKEDAGEEPLDELLRNRRPQPIMRHYRARPNAHETSSSSQSNHLQPAREVPVAANEEAAAERGGSGSEGGRSNRSVLDREKKDEIRARDEGLILGFVNRERVFSEESGSLSHIRPVPPQLLPPSPSPPLSFASATTVSPFPSPSFIRLEVADRIDRRVRLGRRQPQGQGPMDPASSSSGVNQNSSTLTDTRSTLPLSSPSSITNGTLSTTSESASLTPSSTEEPPPSLSSNDSFSATATTTQARVDPSHNRTELELSPRATGAIVGSILGALLLLCIVMFCRRRKVARKEKQTTIRMYAEEWRLRATNSNTNLHNANAANANANSNSNSNSSNNDRRVGGSESRRGLRDESPPLPPPPPTGSTVVNADSSRANLVADLREGMQSVQSSSRGVVTGGGGGIRGLGSGRSKGKSREDESDDDDDEDEDEGERKQRYQSPHGVAAPALRHHHHRYLPRRSSEEFRGSTTTPDPVVTGVRR